MVKKGTVKTLAEKFESVSDGKMPQTKKGTGTLWQQTIKEEWPEFQSKYKFKEFLQSPELKQAYAAKKAGNVEGSGLLKSVWKKVW